MSERCGNSRCGDCGAAIAVSQLFDASARRLPVPSKEMMNVAPPPDGQSSQFGSAWSAFDQATQAAQRVADTWNGLVSTDVFRSNVYVDENGCGRIDVLIDEYEGYRLDDLEVPAHQFVESLLACGREALRSTEQCVSGPLGPPSTDHLPLFGTVSEFLDFVDTGAMSGLRPDHIQLIEQFQPYYRSNSDDVAYQQFRAAIICCRPRTIGVQRFLSFCWVRRRRTCARRRTACPPLSRVR